MMEEIRRPFVTADIVKHRLEERFWPEHWDIEVIKVRLEDDGRTSVRISMRSKPTKLKKAVINEPYSTLESELEW